MQSDDLFLIRYRQLQASVRVQNEESMLLLSQALRQLIVDGDRLMNAANRERRLTIKFKVGFSTEEREAEMRALNLPDPMLHFLGTFPPNEPRRELKIDQFLKFSIAKFQGQHFSVLTLVKTCANRLGGVHAGDPATDSAEEASIRRFGDILSQMGMQHAFASLILIAAVTIEALAPLAAKVGETKKEKPA